ncbi:MULTISPECIES: GlxA family transcriptional regulator [Prauserella salsuginis group]|uniref:GlxA family transcriptional regulator n=1 Tax=Prauserella salsuginis TaxID=387889 RepID=A0ABW6G5N0_9PSEU|nr:MULTISPECIES: DJ-1/PfpI family protein [Prauserella salsuginis group]MCR3719113.1 Transcriptional regulator GlxA family, contains an amidase domain and an AraC-type DNA-binding HTH domain [Prauserella flava]MCR3733683.1 Transcriptional regulator GlxA family, contains an amidase domain and an AraC-type DNA-binding HTH domain [Prauserella salsuginis]
MRVVFVLLPQLHLLDLAGPAQVFSTAAELGCDHALHYVAQPAWSRDDGGDVHSAQGLPLRAETAWPDLYAGDLVVVPGSRIGRPPGWPAVHPETAERLRRHHGGGGTVASVCSGADALGRAGLLDGRRCTTHHELQDELARRYPTARVVRDVLFVTDGRVVTSAGVASGIDLALHLLATREGPGVAARVAREMVVYARRNGDQHQESVMLRHRGHLDDAVHRVQDVIDARFTESLPLATLAEAARCSQRTVTRLFVRATGLTPLRYQHALRLERADHLLNQGATAEAAAHAVGFADARMLRRIRTQAAHGDDTATVADAPPHA